MQFQCATVSDVRGNCIHLALLLIWVALRIVKANGLVTDGQWRHVKSPQLRPHSVSILEFGAVGDGQTVNTVAFQNAIFYLRSFADKGGAQLYVPEGRWLTGSFNLTSHLTLFLEKNAVIIGSLVSYSPYYFLENDSKFVGVQFSSVM